MPNMLVLRGAEPMARCQQGGWKSLVNFEFGRVRWSVSSRLLGPLVVPSVSVYFMRRRTGRGVPQSAQKFSPIPGMSTVPTGTSLSTPDRTQVAKLYQSIINVAGVDSGRSRSAIAPLSDHDWQLEDGSPIGFAHFDPYRTLAGPEVAHGSSTIRARDHRGTACRLRT